MKITTETKMNRDTSIVFDLLDHDESTHLIPRSGDDLMEFFLESYCMAYFDPNTGEYDHPHIDLDQVDWQRLAKFFLAGRTPRPYY